MQPLVQLITLQVAEFILSSKRLLFVTNGTLCFFSILTLSDSRGHKGQMRASSDPQQPKPLHFEIGLCPDCDFVLCS